MKYGIVPVKIEWAGWFGGHGHISGQYTKWAYMKKVIPERQIHSFCLFFLYILLSCQCISIKSPINQRFESGISLQSSRKCFWRFNDSKFTHYITFLLLISPSNLHEIYSFFNSGTISHTSMTLNYRNSLKVICFHVFGQCESRSGGEASTGPRLY